jgi:hypothetical protein
VKTTHDLIQELEAEVTGRSNKHRLHGTVPHDVAFVFHSRSHFVTGADSELGRQALIYQSYPRHRQHVDIIRPALRRV